MGFLEADLLSLFVPTAGRAGAWGHEKVVEGTQKQRLGIGMGRSSKSRVRMRMGLGPRDGLKNESKGRDGMEIGMGMTMEHKVKDEDRAWGQGRVVRSDIGTAPTTTRVKEDEHANAIH